MLEFLQVAPPPIRPSPYVQPLPLLCPVNASSRSTDGARTLSAAATLRGADPWEPVPRQTPCRGGPQTTVALLLNRLEILFLNRSDIS